MFPQRHSSVWGEYRGRNGENGTFLPEDSPEYGWITQDYTLGNYSERKELLLLNSFFAHLEVKITWANKKTKCLVFKGSHIPYDAGGECSIEGLRGGGCRKDYRGLHFGANLTYWWWYMLFKNFCQVFLKLWIRTRLKRKYILIYPSGHTKSDNFIEISRQCKSDSTNIVEKHLLVLLQSCFYAE